jgi:hypothetical protein
VRPGLYTWGGMVRLPEIFFWMSEDERWRYKFVFQALILLVPVVGLVALLGWMTIICDNLRAGRQDVAPSGFHLRRGVKPFAVGIVYWIGLGVPLSGLRYADELWAGRLPLNAVATIYNDLALVFYVILIVPLFVATDRGGFLGGLNVVHVVLSIVRRPIRTVVAALVVLLSIAIGIVGFALIVTAPFTITYAASVVATIAAWWSLPRPAAQVEPPERPVTATGAPVPFRPPGVEPEA